MRRSPEIGSIPEIEIKGAVKYNEPLSRHTTFCIGGPVFMWVEPKDETDLGNVVRFAAQKKMKLIVIGGGSNILAQDSGFKGIVIRLSAGVFKKLVHKGTEITAGAGVLISRFMQYSARHSLSGIEGLSGIYGTVGGALRMNAGNKQSIGDTVTKIRVMDRMGRVKLLQRREIRFGYRTSSLSGYIILGAEFSLKRGTAIDIVKRYTQLIEQKRKTQPLDKKSAGCVFKNPVRLKYSAGEMIDLCGLKGKVSGGAEISQKHANFIVNSQTATARDVLKLIDLVRVAVKKKFGHDLKLELEIL